MFFCEALFKVFEFRCIAFPFETLYSFEPSPAGGGKMAEFKTAWNETEEEEQKVGQ